MNFRMIKGFKCKDTEKVFYREIVYKWSDEIVILAKKKLTFINNANTIIDLSKYSGNRLKKLKGRLSSYYSIRINKQWRIVFRWEKGNAFDVRIIDYH